MDIKLYNEVKYVTKGVVVFDIIIIAILLITSNFGKPMLLSLVFASVIALLNFRLLAITIEKSITMSPNKAQLYTGSRYMIRMSITGIVLIVCAKAPHLSLMGAALGLLGPKFVILTRKLVINKLKRKEA